ncbi:MAG: serine hydrolase [Vicinamibacterales bacterium]
MRISRVVWLGLVGVALGGTALDAQSPLERLQLQVAEAIKPALGDVGVAIRHLESGVEIGVRADEPFPMASAYKLPILVELYAQERAGRVSLDELYTLSPREQHIGSGDLSVNFDLPGVTLSVRNLANLMMMISDNSATDILLTRVGAANVTSRMRSLGLNGIRVDRTTQELILDYGGQDTERLKGMLLQELRPLIRRPPEDEAQRLARDTRYASDPRDQATPGDMTRLLEMLWKGRVVDEAASRDILELMKRCRTGTARIKGLLPRDTVVAHKTGSVGGTIDDVGIIYLPHGAGHVAISVLSKRTRAESADVERVIAEIARYAYDYFLFTAASTPATSRQ